MMALEESKSWAEADADTAEAIDFCEFYAREMERLAQPQPLTLYPGEKNDLEFIPPRGRRGHSALGLSASDPDRDDDGRSRDREYRGSQTVLGRGGDRDDVSRGLRGSGNPRRRPELRDRSGLDRPQHAGRAPEGPDDPVHRLARGGPSDQ
jgi:hypothetical protein